ncbi:MAG: outer membrane lipoprotein-sorting protein [Piscirickettsiaceae bacterium]|nr:MAG: outer membrane lipoprotein-sorting protein [Piscirickettsiaceae bacterium]
MNKFPIIFLLSLFTANVIASAPPNSGTVLNQDNVTQYQEYLDQAVVDLVKKGDLTIVVGDYFDIPQNAVFLEQTEKFKGSASVETPSGRLLNYQGGIPFTSEPDVGDPIAGLKIAWNMRYAYGGDTSIVDPFIWEYRDMNSGKIERTISFVGMTLRYRYRTALAPIPNLPRNPVGIFNAIYLLAKQPFDIKNTQLLVHRLEDDSARERSWLYLSVQRRVRRLPAGQTTDAFLGSDIMIEDFLGYNGRIKDMTWRYLGTKEVLTPFYRHDKLKRPAEASNDAYYFGDFHGKGHCFPNVPWQLRKTYLLEAVPNIKNHPLSKRVFYIDAQTHIPIAGSNYDRNGNIWRVAISAFSHPNHHLEQNKGSGVAIPALISMIDVQANHCTTLKMKTVINSSKVRQKDFTVQALRTKGK